MPSGCATEQSLAAALNVTPRTLQRRLREEGTTYNALLEEVRRELATHYVRQSERSINEITCLLGFSEPSNFTRAFKRWTGSTPRVRASRPALKRVSALASRRHCPACLRIVAAPL